MTSESQKLLADFVQNGSELAFRQLVERYTNLVYSTAFRATEGDGPLAQDVTQTVFLDLARMAGKLSGVMLGGWLHRHTYFVCLTALRAERRRRKREGQAAGMNTPSVETVSELDRIGPLLDAAINQLSEPDRKAILFRFFEQASFRAVGEALGANEDAARMRVSRAVEKLHLILRKRGFAGSSLALGALLAGSAEMSAPAGLAATVSSVALTRFLCGNSSTTLLKVIAMTKLKTSLIGTLLVAGIAMSVKMHRQAQAQLQVQNSLMEEQNEALGRLNSENRRLSNLVFQANSPRAPGPSSELLKLRAEVGTLRRELAAGNERQTRRLEPQVEAEQKPEIVRPYFGAETWANLGYQDPQSAAITFLWALRNTNQLAYSGAFGRNMPELEDAWVDAYQAVKGTFFSDALFLPNGDAQVTAAHEVASGEIVNTVITYHQDQGLWMIRNMTGFPVAKPTPTPPSPLASSN